MKTVRAPSLLRTVKGLVFASLLTSCATGGHSPVADLDHAPGLETIAIIGTNDIHGTLLPFHLKTREPEGDAASIDYEAAGTPVLASYIQVIRSEFGGRSLWLDAGDEFQGSIESNTYKGAPMVDFFNLEGLQGAAIGNHEFDFDVAALKDRMEQAKYPYLSANIIDKATGDRYAFPNTLPSKLYDVGGIKVGVVGLSTRDTPRTTRAEYVKGLAFSDLREATLHEAQSLRQNGAQLILIVAHVGLECEAGRSRQTYLLRKESDPQGDCDPHGEMVSLIHSLPKGTVDAVIAGHSHQIVHHWIDGVPVIQGGATGRYLNVIYLVFDKATGKLAADRTRIEGPIPVCEKIFENQGDCNGDRPAPSDGRGPLIRAIFHGVAMKPAPEVEKLIDPVAHDLAAVKDRVVGTAARPLEHQRFAESMLGNLVADAIRVAAKTDVALVNTGGIRAPIEAGPIKYESVFRTFPFENSIATLHVSGHELKTILRIAESGSRGFFPVSGLRLRLVDPKYDAPSSDLNGDGRIQAWEVNRLLEAKFSDGSPIRDEKSYTLATLDFLVTGGDDLGWIMEKIPTNRIQWNTGGLVRDAVASYLAANSPVNTVEKPLVDENDPRFVFEKPKLKAAGRRRRHKRH